MKKSIFIVAIMGLMTFGVQAQVPDKVTKAFETKYKNAKELSWTSYGDEYYANFELNQQVKTATFMKDGQWATTVTVLLETKLPDCINDLVGENYAGNQITGAEFVETPQSSKYYVTIQSEVTGDNDTEEDEEIEEYDEDIDEDVFEDDSSNPTSLIFGKDCKFLGEEE